MVRVGVVGLGRLGTRHAEIYARTPGVTLDGVADIDPQRCRQAADRFQVEACSGAAELCRCSDLDAVSICTPDWAHRDPALEAIACGKHLFIEKPLADDEDQAAEIVQSAQAARVKLMVGQLLRFDARYCEARATLRSGAIGEVVHVFGKRNSYITGPEYYGGRYNLPFHLAIHEIDLLLWMIDSPVVDVYAQSTSRALAHRGMADTLFTILRFANGAIACLEHSWVLRPDCGPLTLGPQMEIVGTEGSIQIAGNGGIEVSTAEGLALPDLGVLGRLSTGAFTGCLAAALESFVRCVDCDAEPPVTGQEGLAAVRVATAITRSLASRLPVSVNPSARQ